MGLIANNSYAERYRSLRVWVYAAGYFLSYVPYAAITKAVSDGSGDRQLSGLSLLPLSVAVSSLGMMLFIAIAGYYRLLPRVAFAGLVIPVPGRFTFLSGLCSAAIIGSTTMAYTFRGTSIVLMMLLMRGGVLLLAPVIDLLSKHHVAWFSWVALVLSAAGIALPISDAISGTLSAPAAIDAAIYLVAYFVRLRLMGKLGKSGGAEARRRYFAEEQLVASPALLFVLACVAGFLDGPIADQLRAGFTTVWRQPVAVWVILIGLFSQGTGIFGALVLLEPQEHSFCVPINRASSVLAGMAATLVLAAAFGSKLPQTREWLGASCLVIATAMLAWPALQARVQRTSRP